MSLRSPVVERKPSFTSPFCVDTAVIHFPEIVLLQTTRLEPTLLLWWFGLRLGYLVEELIR